MSFTLSIPKHQGFRQISIEEGSSAYFCGANGSGKTRLAVFIEDSIGLQAHRISAHRALSLNPSVAKIPEKSALAGLRVGHVKGTGSTAHTYRSGHRWKSNAAVSLLNDFDFLVQALFAEQSNTALKSHRQLAAEYFGPATPTNFEQLGAIWERLLPERKLEVTADDIQVAISGIDATISASKMSDAEPVNDIETPLFMI